MKISFVEGKFYLVSQIPGVVELFFFLRNPAINLLLGLAKLKGGPEHLVLLGLKSTFGLLQG